MKRLLCSLLAVVALVPVLASTPKPVVVNPAPPIISAQTDVIVWVNLSTGIYHYAHTRWYGKTKHGKYMKESEAKRDGYRAAENGQ